MTEQQLQIIADLSKAELDREFDTKEDREAAFYYLIKTMLVLLLDKDIPVGNKNYAKVLRVLANAYELLDDKSK